MQKRFRTTLEDRLDSLTLKYTLEIVVEMGTTTCNCGNETCPTNQEVGPKVVGVRLVERLKIEESHPYVDLEIENA